MRTVYRPLTPLAFVWTDLFAGLRWFADCFGGLTAMVLRETTFSTLRVIARKKLRMLETMLRGLLVVEAARMRLTDVVDAQHRAAPASADTAPQPALNKTRKTTPRDDPEHPENWRATFPLPRHHNLFAAPASSGAWTVDALTASHARKPIDLAPMARRLEAIRRVLADLPAHARRWATLLAHLTFRIRKPPRTHAERESIPRASRDGALEHAEYEHYLWKRWRWDSS